LSSNQKIVTFLMFEGQAEEAMNLYTSLFEDSRITNVIRYGPEGPGKEGTILHAAFTLKGQTLMCIDSYVQHGFTFTPAISLYVNCDTEEEINKCYEILSQDGQVLMPLGAYPFSAKYAWVQDKYGVTWQLNFGGILA